MIVATAAKLFFSCVNFANGLGDDAGGGACDVSLVADRAAHDLNAVGRRQCLDLVQPPNLTRLLLSSTAPPLLLMCGPHTSLL
jgi:hypothetical protein